MVDEASPKQNEVKWLQEVGGPYYKRIQNSWSARDRKMGLFFNLQILPVHLLCVRCYFGHFPCGDSILMGQMMKCVFGEKIVPGRRKGSYKFVLVYDIVGIYFQGQVQLNVVLEGSLL